MTEDQIKHRMAWLRQEATDAGRHPLYPDTAVEIDEIERLAKMGMKVNLALPLRVNVDALLRNKPF